MSNTPVEDLLAVKWFDGLLVGSGHLAHADRRMVNLIAEACGALADQPGLIGEDSGGRTASQLVEIESQTALDDGIEVKFNFTRGFQALTPGGRLVIGVPNAQARFGIPVTSISTILPGQGDPNSDFLVCATQIEREDLKVERKQGTEEAIDLEYPGLGVELVESGDFKQRVASDFGNCAVVGLITLMDGEVAVDTEFIPPVLRLQSVASFDDGIVASLKTLIQDLYRFSVDLVQTSNMALAQGDLGADLLSRRTDYLALRTLLLHHVGRVRGLERISPARFMFDVVSPLATWWRQYYRQHFQQTVSDEQSPVKKLDDVANALLELTYTDLCAGTGDLLGLAKKFVEGLNRELMIG